MSDTASGAHIEIIERSSHTDPLGNGYVVPNMVRINGQEILIPEGAQITISPITDHEVVTINLTMFVASLAIRQA